MVQARRTALERAVANGKSLPDALRDASVQQLGRLVESLDAEVDRLERSEPLDTAAALRVAKTWRQLLPLMQMHERTAPPEPAQPAPKPLSLAQRIARDEPHEGHEALAPAPGHNGHAAAPT